MPNVPYPYEVNGKLVTENGSLIPKSSLSNRSLLPSLTALLKWHKYGTLNRVIRVPGNYDFVIFQFENSTTTFVFLVDVTDICMSFSMSIRKPGQIEKVLPQ